MVSRGNSDLGCTPVRQPGHRSSNVRRICSYGLISILILCSLLNNEVAMDVPAYRLKQSFILRPSTSTPRRDRLSVDGGWRLYREEGFGGGSFGASRAVPSAKAKDDGGFMDTGVSGAGGSNDSWLFSRSLCSLSSACIFKLSISRCIAALLQACQLDTICVREVCGDLCLFLLWNESGIEHSIPSFRHLVQGRERSWLASHRNWASLDPESQVGDMCYMIQIATFCCLHSAHALPL